MTKPENPRKPDDVPKGPPIKTFDGPGGDPPPPPPGHEPPKPE